MKKVVMAAVAVFIFLMATNYLVHSILLMPDYDAIPLSHRNLAGIEHRFWAMVIGQVFFSAMFAYIYTRGAEKKAWMAQGIRYGVLVTFLTIVPTSLTEYVVYIVPYMLVIKWMVAGGIQLVLAGVLVAGICKEGGGA